MEREAVMQTLDQALAHVRRVGVENAERWCAGCRMAPRCAQLGKRIHRTTTNQCLNNEIAK